VIFTKLGHCSKPPRWSGGTTPFRLLIRWASPIAIPRRPRRSMRASAAGFGSLSMERRSMEPERPLLIRERAGAQGASLRPGPGETAHWARPHRQRRRPEPFLSPPPAACATPSIALGPTAPLTVNRLDRDGLLQVDGWRPSVGPTAPVSILPSRRATESRTENWKAVREPPDRVKPRGMPAHLDVCPTI